MKKNSIRLTEGELNRIIKESVKRVINESKHDDLYSLAQKMVANLSDSDRKFAWHTFNHHTWDLVYALLSALEGAEDYAEPDEDDLITNWGDKNYDI